MKITIGASSSFSEAQELKNKIVEYLHNKPNITLIESQDMSSAATELHDQNADKAILVCRSGTSAISAALNAKIARENIGKHGEVPAEKINNYAVYTTGFNLPWDEIQRYLDTLTK